MKKMKKENGGFSLIEVLIAMSILAICAAPLMQSFVRAIQTNAKSRTLLNATTIAENVMEDIKADGAAAYLRLGEADAIAPNDPSAEYKTYETGYAHYQLDNRDYSVDVTLTESDRQAATAADSYNKMDLSELYRMSTTTDAIYVQPETLLEEMAETYVNLPTTDSEEFMVSPADILSGLSASYTFTITRHDSDYVVRQENLFHSPKGFEIGSTSSVLYETINDNMILERLYIFITPSPNTTITIKNEDKSNVEMYLVVQKNTAATISLNIIEDIVHGGSDLDPVYTPIRQNVDDADYNLVNWGTCTYNATNCTYTDMKNKFGMSALDNANKQENARIYDVVVSVKDAEGNVLSTLDGTALQ